MNEVVGIFYSMRVYMQAPRMSMKERAFCAKRLSFLVSSGMTLPVSLMALETQTDARAVREALATIRGDIENGKSLGESMTTYPYLFDAFSVQVIRTGEATGTLSENLAYLADELQKRSQLRAKITGAFMYPLLIAVFTLGLTGSLILFIFPKIIPVFSGLRVTLPLSTRILLSINEYVRHWGLLTLAVLAVLFILFFVALRNIKMKQAVERILFRMPLIGSIMRSYTLGNAARTLALLLTSGMTLREALPATAHATGNSVYRAEFESLSETVERGGDMSTYLRERKAAFPELIAQMISVGESSGSLSETLRYISAYYESEVDELTKRLSTLVEPVLMIVMGSIVGFVAISMITPLYEITQHLHAK